MKPIFKYLIIAIIGVLLYGMFFKGCNKRSMEDVERDLKIEKTLTDSIKAVQWQLLKTNDSLMLKNTYDSLSYLHINDSLKHVIGVLQSRFSVARDSIGTMYANLKKFYQEHDTVKLYDTYNRLQSELSQANQLLFSVQISRDSLENAKDSEISRLRVAIIDLQEQLVAFNKLLTQSTENQSKLAKTANEAINKAKRKSLLLKITGGIAFVLAAIAIL
jgi:hypothetical protein